RSHATGDKARLSSAAADRAPCGAKEFRHGPAGFPRRFAATADRKGRIPSQSLPCGGNPHLGLGGPRTTLGIAVSAACERKKTVLHNNKFYCLVCIRPEIIKNKLADADPLAKPLRLTSTRSTFNIRRLPAGDSSLNSTRSHSIRHFFACL